MREMAHHVVVQHERERGHGHEREREADGLPGLQPADGRHGEHPHELAEEARRGDREAHHAAGHERFERQARPGDHEEDDVEEAARGREVHVEEIVVARVVAREEAEGEEGEDHRELEHRCEPHGRDHDAGDQREVQVLGLVDAPRDDAREARHRAAQDERAEEEIRGMQQGRFHVHARLEVRGREEDRRDDRGEEAIQRDQVQRSLGDLAFGPGVLHDQHHHRGRGRHGDGRRDARLHRREVEDDQGREHRGEGEEALREARGGERPVALHPLQVHAPAEVEEHQPQGEIHEDARLVEEEVEADEPREGRHHESHRHVADDARQPHGARHLAAHHAGDQQHAEHQREAELQGQRRKEAEIHGQSRMARTRIGH